MNTLQEIKNLTNTINFLIRKVKCIEKSCKCGNGVGGSNIDISSKLNRGSYTGTASDLLSEIHKKVDNITYTSKIQSIDTQIQNLNTNKVDKVPGKGLSTNDFTTALKNKLEAIQPPQTGTINSSDLEVTTSNGKVLYDSIQIELKQSTKDKINEISNKLNSSDLVKRNILSTSDISITGSGKILDNDITIGLSQSVKDKLDKIATLQTAINNINTLLQSDDTTLDELQEIVDYIKQKNGGIIIKIIILNFKVL